MFLLKYPEQGQLIALRRAEPSPIHNSLVVEGEHCPDEEGFEVQFGHGRVYQTDEH
jgi:hypothetical protein